MALIKCSECGNEVSDRAAACPRCGAPTEPAGVVPTPAAPSSVAPSPVAPSQPAGAAPAVTRSWVLLAVSFCALVLAVGFVVIDRVMAGKSQASDSSAAARQATIPNDNAEGDPAATHAPTGPSWSERADEAVTAMLNDASGPAAAQSIQHITHPTGGGASLAAFDVRHAGKNLSVRLTVSWSGGFGANHTTVVVWTFNRDEHVAARILSDNSPIHVAAANAQQLDRYFQNEMYPVLLNNVRQ